MMKNDEAKSAKKCTTNVQQIIIGVLVYKDCKSKPLKVHRYYKTRKGAVYNISVISYYSI